jgi:hypothetical protein
LSSTCSTRRPHDAGRGSARRPPERAVAQECSIASAAVDRRFAAPPARPATSQKEPPLSGSARGSLACLLPAAILVLLAPSAASAQRLGDVPDVSREFLNTEHVYFIGQKVGRYDADTGAGTLEWARHRRTLGLSFNKLDLGFGAGESNEFPGTEYDKDPALPFEISFVTPRTVRVRLSTRTAPFPDDAESLMLAAAPPRDTSWTVDAGGDAVTYASAHGRVRLVRDPWHLEFYDASGRLLTRTMHLDDGGSFAQPVPFSFIRRANDLSRNIAAAFQLAPDEKLYGGGESFTRLNKRGSSSCARRRSRARASCSTPHPPASPTGSPTRAVRWDATSWTTSSGAAPAASSMGGRIAG